jgi:hypothetical protein
MDFKYPKKIERGEGGVIKTVIVPADVVDTRPDQGEGDADEDEPEDDSPSTPAM